MLKIKLQRIGRNRDPHFRVVITDARNAPKSGKFIEVIGSYNPKSGITEVKSERATYWISKGAQPSGTVHNFLVGKGVIEGKKINVLPKKSPTKKRKEAKKK